MDQVPFRFVKPWTAFLVKIAIYLHSKIPCSKLLQLKCYFTLNLLTIRVKSGNFGHQVNSDIHLPKVEIQMSRLIWIYTVCKCVSEFT